MPIPVTLPPFQTQFIATADLTVHVESLPADRPPMVLVHGIGMDWRVWQAIARRLFPYFRLYLLDLRGHGQSDKPEHGYSLAHYAADIEDVLQALGLRDVVLVGSSLGAMAAAVVEAPSDVVPYRILVDPPLSSGPVHDPDNLRQILRLKHQPVDLLAQYLRGSYPRSGTHLLRMMSEMWHATSDGVLTDLLDHVGDYFAIDAALRAHESRTLLLQAEASLGGVLTDAAARSALRQLPDGELRTVPGAGHAIHADRPADFVRHVLEFTGTSETGTAL